MADRKQKRVKQRRGFVDVINALLTLMVIGLLVAGGLALYGAHTFYAVGPIAADTTFTVEKGNNLGAVGQRLEAQGLIDNRYVFQLGGFVLKKQGALKVGEYTLTAGASMYDVLKELTEGKPVALSITIPEGFTVAQVIDRLTNNDKLTGSITTPPTEGSILPDTYDFDPGSTRQAVLDRMEAAMQTKLADVWQSRDPAIPLTTPDQLVTLASIVEKETPVAAERAKIAGVYYNRLARHMRLQSDPTVVYGITKGAGAAGRAPTRSELDQSTPYNTYQVDGLPPTPIANPGIDALKAAANPEHNNNVYFVAVSLNPKDGHLFAPTYSEHRKNVAKLRVLEKQQAVADAEADSDNAKDQLEQQAATAAGDPTAAAAATAAAAPDQTAPPAAPADQPPSSPDNNTLVDTSVAPATSPGDPNAPIPMPADQRPGGIPTSNDIDTSSPPVTAPATAAPDDTPAATAPVTTPATPATTPTTPAPSRPAAKPKPKPAPADTFGG